MNFFVPGKPIGQGRISTFQGRSVHSNAKELLPWRELVGWIGRKNFRATPIPKDEAVWIRYEFVFLKPKSVKRDELTVKPDLDHLTRSCGDALSGIIYRDDSQVTLTFATKRYGEVEGVHITILTKSIVEQSYDRLALADRDFYRIIQELSPDS